MTKGKYAAKAKNRLANLDNRLLQEKLTEVEELNQEIQRLKAALDSERRDRGRLVIERAHELSASSIENIRTEADVVLEAAESRSREAALRLVGYFKIQDNFPAVFIKEVLPALIPSGELNAFVEEMLADAVTAPSVRYTRRHAAQNIRRQLAREHGPEGAKQMLVGYMKTRHIDEDRGAADVEEAV